MPPTRHFYLFVFLILGFWTAETQAASDPSARDEAEKQVWTFASPPNSWEGGPLPHGHWPVHDGAMWVKFDGSKNPTINMGASLPADRINVLQIAMDAPTAKQCLLSFTTDVSPLPSAQRTVSFDLHPSPGTQIYNLDFQDLPSWKNKIAGLRFTFAGGASGDEITVRSVKMLEGLKISKPLIYTPYVAAEKPMVREFRMGSLFNSGMILQRDRLIAVWGHAEAGKTVTVEFAGKQFTSQVANGYWEIALPAMAAGGPYELKATDGKDKINLSDILIGDVWLGAGQSNMGPTAWDNPPPAERKTELLNTDYPNLRVVKMPTLNRDEPLPNDAMEDSLAWKPATRSQIKKMSGIAYYFGQEIQTTQKIPIGLLLIIKAGSQLEQWTDADTLKALYTPDEFQQICATRHLSSGLYNGMLAPVIPFGIKGVFWYQGESNGNTPAMYAAYQRGLPAFIQSWRKKWGIGDFPFLLVQLPQISHGYPPESWAYLRDAQFQASKNLPNVGLDVTIDTGEPANLHPHNKYIAGTRLGLLARGMVYGENIEYCGPIYRSATAKGNNFVVSFDHAGSGLKPQPALTGFQICGPDKNFVDATATITGKDQITLSSDKVARPIAARYAWDNNPTTTLFNQEGLPASPFTTLRSSMTEKKW